jgi:hypothetical protein
VIPNRVHEDTIAAFMDECFLKAVHECIPGKRWPSKHEIQKAKSAAAGIEGRVHRKARRHMELAVTLAAEYIGAVWKKCQRLLREIKRQALSV